MSDHSTPLGGTCGARFEPLRELFVSKLESGEDLGASVALNIDGEMVVDLWAGWADEARSVPWGENTITNVFSTTKTTTALAALALVDIGAGNGHGNARSVARLQSALACGGEVDGVRLLSPKTIGRIFETQSDGIDLVIGVPFKFGVGYSLFPEGRVCAWGGAGGSCVIIDVDRRITFAYVMNKMAPGSGTIAAALAQRVADIVKG